MSDDWNTPLNETESSALANPISLADVLSLRVPVHWTEAVAVIEELCLVLSADGEPASIPEPHGVVVTAQGAVMIRRGTEGAHDVDAIGRMLNVLLDPVTTPIPLRLFVAHSIGSEKYQTVTAYGEALAYYARPDRTELIQALYLRCLQAPVAPLPPLVVEEPVRIEPPPPVPVVAAARRRALPQWMRVTAVLAILAVCSFVVVRQLSGNSRAAPVANLKAAAADVVQAVRHLVVTHARESQAAPLPESQPVEAGGRARPRARQVRDGDAPTAIATTHAADDVVAVTEPSMPIPVDSERVHDSAFALPRLTPSPTLEALLAAAPADPTIYSSASPDVLPPVMYSPKLPPMPPDDPFLRGTNTMELLIDETGVVQQARLTSTPVRMSDMLLLSPAKTWRFYPALKNGRPVKYRLSLSWVVAPP